MAAFLCLGAAGKRASVSFASSGLCHFPSDSGKFCVSKAVVGSTSGRVRVARETPRCVSSSPSSSQYDYDLFVIGAGSGGVRASRIAASYGARVACAEERYLGGTCVNVGCVPKKLFVYGSHYGHMPEEARNFGWDFGADKKLDWARLIENKNAEIERLNSVYGRILENAGVQKIWGTASIVDAHTVQIGEQKYTTDKILIATGGWPNMPKVPGIENAISSNEFFFLKDLPKRTLVVGGGYIAVEFACLLNGYGSQVTQIYRSDLYLRGFDRDVREFLAEQMVAQGVNLKFKTDLKEIVKLSSGAFKVALTTGDEIEVDCIICATGRNPKSSNLGIAEVGVKMGKKGEILVNDRSQTNVPNIYAVGDVTDRVNLTPVALAEGHCFADSEFGGKVRMPSYEMIPTAVFSNPTIGTCGLTEEEADAKYGRDDVDVYKTNFRPMKQTIAQGTERTLMKLIVHRSTDKVVGCHIVEPAAGEVIQLVGVAMKAGATKAHFDATIGVHPTAAEELVTLRSRVDRS